MSVRRTAVALVTAAVATGALVAAPPASAVQAKQSAVVSTVPQAGTPAVDDGTVSAIAQVGSTMVVGGTFHSVTAADGTTYDTPYVTAFDASTGAVRSTFRPAVDGDVDAVLPGPTADTVYLGGAFKTVGGAEVRGLTLVKLADGSRVAGFAPVLSGGVPAVLTLARVGSRLYVGGTFTAVGGVAHGGIATVNATTGAVDPFLRSAVAVNHNWTTSSPSTAKKGPVGVKDLDITPDGTKLVAIGNFKQVDGKSLDQIAMWDLGGTSAVLRDWRTARFVDACGTTHYDSWVRDVDFSPDGAYFVVASVGGYKAGGLCDTASRWESATTGQDVQPTWVAYSGGDSIMSTAVTGTAVYVGGHQRWLNNGTGRNVPGGGAVPRPGVAALDPVNGMPLAWNPGRHPRGVGTAALYATSTGLWMGSDTETIGIGATMTTRKRLAFFPLAGGGGPVATTVPVLPAGVYSGPKRPTPSTSSILYRINAGGPALLTVDGGPDWSADQGTTSTYRADSGSKVEPYAVPVTRTDSTVPSGTPRAVYAEDRLDGGAKGDGKEMQYRLPVTKGTSVTVRLYFANRKVSHAAVGKRVFDVRIDGVLKTDDYDIFASVGDDVGTMRSYTVTSDGSVDVQLTHEVAHPLVAAIEVVKAGSAAVAATKGSLTARSFDGTTAGSAVAVDSHIEANGVRGATMIGGALYYGKADGSLYRRPLSNGTWGSSVLLDPYDDPTWSGTSTGSEDPNTGLKATYRGTRPSFYDELTNVTSMFYDPRTGRLYYTLYKQSALYYRAFSPDSGAIHFARSTVAGVVLPTDLTGAFLSGSTLYYATSNGNLTRVGFTGSALSGTPTVVSGPAKGVDWSSRALFLGPKP